jgi:hypothetical protein
MQYITNGQSYSEFSGTHAPSGCWFISEQDYYAALRTDAEGYERAARNHRESVLAVRATAKVKLMEGTPLTEEEAEIVLG